MTKSFDRVFQLTTTTGTGTMTLGASVAANVITFAQANAVDGDIVNYVIEDGVDFEIGKGTIGGDRTTLTRTTVSISKIGGFVGTTKIDLSGNARVRSVEPADFFNHLFPAGETVKTSNYTIVADDRSKIIIANSASPITFNFSTAASLNGMIFIIKNNGSGDLTLDPNTTETIDGNLTLILKSGQSTFVLSNGSSFISILKDSVGLFGLSDVDFDTIPPEDGDGLVFDESEGKWKPGPAGGGMFKGNNFTVGSRSGDIFRINAKLLTEDVIIDATENASATGPLEVATGVTLEVATGGTLVIL